MEEGKSTTYNCLRNFNLWTLTFADISSILFQNGPLPLKYRVRQTCKRIKIGIQQDGVNNTSGDLESDSGSDKANSPAAAPSTSSSLPSPCTPGQSPHSHFPHISTTMNGSSNTNHQIPFSKNRPRKPSVNGSSVSSGWQYSSKRCNDNRYLKICSYIW